MISAAKLDFLNRACGSLKRLPSAAAVKAPPPGALNRIDQCVRVLETAAFVDSSAEIVRSEWLLRDGRALLAALSAGTVRMAALIAAQEPSAIAATSIVRPNVSAATKISQFRRSL